jgi:molybdate transport system substrate-binding protein
VRAVPRLLLVAGAVAAAGCSSTQNNVSPMSSTSSPGVVGTLEVDAAASLKTTFDQIAAQFEQAHPGVAVSISYDGSAVLATQILAGAPVDVFASADTKNMARVTKPKLIEQEPIEFATNTLQIAVAAGNPKKISTLKDLAGPGLNVDLCATAQPCGAAAQTALAAAGVTLTPVSSEQNVTAVLTKVESGDADAGLVYRTDVLGAAGKVTGVDFPQAAKAVNHYPIGALANSDNLATAEAFIAFVTGAKGQHILANAGFGKPTP